MSKQFKVAIVGPESTGKSSLSFELAQYYNTKYVPEIARYYLDEMQFPYEEIDLLKIAKRQTEAEDKISLQAENILICDTTLLVIKIWSEVKYNRCDAWILEEEQRRQYDLFLLCNIDLEWVADPQREHPDKREFLFNLYFESLISRTVPFEVVSGNGINRVKKAIEAIEKNYSEFNK